ncbi:MAG: hypothetical protein FRX49_02187 [Trebouxia sp. A1-2]|nr:MAG: hypothetical protein FRX49_02187 [Trebouxia sp. A1-2]
MGEEYVLLATANKASQLEQAKLVWGHHLPLRWRNSQTFTSVQRAIGWFVVANCIASKIFIIAVASIHCAQAKADRMPALTGHEVINDRDADGAKMGVLKSSMRD